MNGISKALITGGSNGLGAALVQQLLGDSAEVISVDVKPGKTVENLRQITCDLGNRDALDDAIPAILEGGPYDLVIFNAGISATGPFEKIPQHAHLKLLRINAETPMVLAAKLAGSGAMNTVSSMSFISSLSHYTGYPGAASYAASKDALAVYARSIRKSFAKQGISVSAVFPGPLRTGHAERHAPPGADVEKRMTPDEAAAEILKAIKSGKRTIIPGTRNRAIALAGRLVPSLITLQMRKMIFEKLDKPKW